MSVPSADDIDSLLDQVENKYIKKQSKPPKLKTQGEECPCNAKTSTDWDEVEELLRDFTFEDTNPFGKQNNNSWARKEVKRSTEPETREVKCFPVYLSGSYDALGRSETGFERPCDQLKCLRCDFTVINFDNYAWDDSTDYLFLRTNMPDFDKLAAKLRRKNGSRAYACQCQHVTISHMTNVNSLPQLRWVCGKHSTSGKLDSLSTKYTQRF